MHRLENRVYCKCRHCVGCGCSRWWHHHDDVSDIVPNKVRPFDGLRCVIESLWSPVVEGVRAGWKANRRAM